MTKYFGLLHCPVCLSTDIENQCWVKTNTDEVIDPGGSEYFCPDCDGHFRRAKFTSEILGHAIARLNDDYDARSLLVTFRFILKCETQAKDDHK